MKKLVVVAAMAAMLLGTSVAQAVVLIDTTVIWSANGSEPDQTGRIVRDGAASTWAAPKANPLLFTINPNDYVSVGLNAGIYDHIQVTVTDPDGSPGLFSVAYSSFNPADPTANYLADPGESLTTQLFQFVLAPGSNFTVVLSTVSGVGTLAGNRSRILVEGFVGDPGQTPLPAAAWMFGGGLLGITALARRRARRKLAA